MQFRVLGNLEVVRDDGAAIDLGGAQPRLVVAMLVAAAGHIVPVDSLIEGVWGDRVPDSAAGTLQSYVSRLRRELEPHRARRAQSRVLVWEPPGYRLDVPASDVDFLEFERLATEGRELVRADRPQEARERLLGAEALWRGEAFVEFADHDFARGLVARLDERRLAALEDRFTADLALGRHDAVIGELTELVGRHPLREGLWAGLALALYRSGRQAEALRALDEMRTTLVEELGVDPSPPLRELERRILDHDPSLSFVTSADPAVGGSGGPPGRAGGSPESGGLFGRGSESAELVGALDEAVAGRARFGVVEGEPGIGKTSLLEVLSEVAGARGATVRWGRCHEGGAAPAFWPWLEVLRGLRDQIPGDADEHGELAQLLSPTAPVDDEGAGGPVDRFALFEAVAGSLERAAEVAPLVVVIDDVQWADPASLELLEFLAGRLADSAVLLLVSVRQLDVGRNDAVVAALAALTRRPGTRRLALRGLGESDTASLIERTTGVAPTQPLVRAIHERADGNPFFVSELARLVAADGITDPNELVGRAEVPAGVRDVVSRRLARLPDATIEVLRVAAVLGRGAELGLIARVADLDLEQCLADLEPAVVTRLVVADPDAVATFRFAHALVREVVLDELATARRAVLHRRAAAAIVELSGDTDDNAEIVAAHLWEAVPLGGRREAAAALERAAEVAVRRFAYESAESLLERAVQLRGVSGVEPADLEAELLAISHLARVRRMVRGFALATHATPLERAHELAERTGRIDLMVELLWAERVGVGTQGMAAHAVELSARLFALADESSDPDVRMVAHYNAGVQCWEFGRFPEARLHFAMGAALEHDRTLDDRRTVFRDRAILDEARQLSRGFSIVVDELVGDVGDTSDRAAAFVEEQTNPYGVVMAHTFNSYIAATIGDPVRAAAAGRNGLAADPDSAFTFFSAAAGMHLAWALAEFGELDESLELWDQHLAAYLATDVRTIMPMYLAHHAMALVRVGRLDEAADRLVEADRLAGETLERWAVPIIELSRAEWHLARDDADAMDASLARARAVADELGSLGLARRCDRTSSHLRMGGLTTR